MICLVIAVFQRDLSLLNHIKHDPYFDLLLRETVHEHTLNITVTGFVFLDVLINNYITVQLHF